jgi:phosphatidate cytidylyltransferase
VAIALSSLSLRVISALVLAPPVLLAVWQGSPYFEGMALLAAALMAWEWGRLVCNGAFTSSGIALTLTCLAALAMLPFSPIVALFFVILGGMVSSLMAPAGARGWAALGAPYIVLPLAALVMLREADNGQSLVIWLLLIVWATDIGAYAAGRAIGGPLLAPAISPKKTWAGLLGGMLSAGLTAILAGMAFGFTTQAVTLGGIGAVLAVVAQGGDLFESQAKRRFGVKDSSQLIPGHGGLLDRVDGLLAAGFALGLYHLVAIERGWTW